MNICMQTLLQKLELEFERQTNVFMQIILQKVELEFARFISKQLGGTLGFLLYEVYLENAHYWKIKTTFVCRLLGEIGAIHCKVSKQVISKSTCLCVA